jgi:hypothetical protein
MGRIEVARITNGHSTEGTITTKFRSYWNVILLKDSLYEGQIK